MVGYAIKLDNIALSLQSHYEPSSLALATLALATSPLRPASALSFSWDRPLNFSLCIGPTGSNVSHKSVDQIHTASMPEAPQEVNRCSLN